MLDPTMTTGLQFLDFGSVYSSDGREHPITAMTPAYVDRTQPTSTNSYDTPSTSLYGPSLASANASAPSSPGVISSLLPSLPPHFGARLAVSVIAIAILLIVVIRLLLK